MYGCRYPVPAARRHENVKYRSGGNRLDTRQHFDACPSKARVSMRLHEKYTERSVCDAAPVTTRQAHAAFCQQTGSLWEDSNKFQTYLNHLLPSVSPQFCHLCILQTKSP